MLATSVLCTSLVGCSCEYPNFFQLPDDDTVRSITLEGAECAGRYTECSSRHASGRCHAIVATAEDDARCTVRVDYASGATDTFEAVYRGEKGCECGSSSLPNETVERAIARRATDAADAAAPRAD